jgi:hypothetical protein
VADKQMKAFANQVQMTKNAVTVLGIEIGEMLAPVLAEIASYVKDAVQWFRSLDPSVKAATVAVVTFTTLALAGVAGLILGFKALNILTGGFPIVVGLLVTGAAALGAGAGLFVAKMGGIGPVFDRIKKFTADVKEWFQPLLPALKSLWGAVVDVVDRGLTKLEEMAVNVWKSISGGAEIDWNKVRDYAKTTIQYMEYSLRNLDKTAELAWAGVKYYSVSALNYVLNNIAVVLGGPASLLLFTNFTKNWAEAWRTNQQNTRLSLSGISTMVEKFYLAQRTMLKGDFVEAIDIMKDALSLGMGNEFKFVGAGIKVDKLDKLEKELKDEFDRLKDESLVGFREWQRQVAVEEGIGKAIFQRSGVKDLPEQFNKKGQETGEQFVQGLNKGLKKADFAEFGSQEANARIQAYAQAIGIGGFGSSLNEFVKIGKGGGGFRVPEENRKLRDEKNADDNKNALNNIANASKETAKNTAKGLLVKLVRF